MNKDEHEKFKQELDKKGGEFFEVKLTGAMIIYILETLKEKSIGLMLKRMLEDGKIEKETVESTNAIVGSYLLDQAVKLLGKEMVESYFGKGSTDHVESTQSGTPKVRKDLH